ncbi:hypothetical protein [Borreliella garinii]|nr:hypothetical protein [Borreliella garinii]
MNSKKTSLRTYCEYNKKNKKLEDKKKFKDKLKEPEDRFKKEKGE